MSSKTVDLIVVMKINSFVKIILIVLIVYSLEIFCDTAGRCIMTVCTRTVWVIICLGG